MCGVNVRFELRRKGLKPDMRCRPKSEHPFFEKRASNRRSGVRFEVQGSALMSGSSSPAQGAQTGLHTSHVRFELRGQELKPDIVVSGLSHVRFELQNKSSNRTLSCPV